ncbi:MAG: hypothetical protein ACR2QG_04410 [Gammaproteobacteria bacterium]
MRTTILILACLSFSSSYAFSAFGTSGEPRPVGKIRMQELGGELMLLIYAPEGEQYEFAIASGTDANTRCDLDGDNKTPNAILKIDQNPSSDYYYAMLLSAISSGSKIMLSYDKCMMAMGTSWPIVYSITLHSPLH